MKEYVDLGQVPCNEECAQVGQDDYYEKSSKECRAYVNQLKRFLKGKDEECGLKIIVKSYAHDFGSYKEVCAVFSDENEEAANLAYELEGNAPSNWDDEARKELNI